MVRNNFISCRCVELYIQMVLKSNLFDLCWSGFNFTIDFSHRGQKRDKKKEHPLGCS